MLTSLIILLAIVQFAHPALQKRDALIIILTYDRPESLQRLLLSARRAHYERTASIDLKVRIDVDSDRSVPHNATVAVAQNFLWPHGQKIVEITKRNENIAGQWLHCAEQAPYTHKVFTILEDDMELSPHYHTWLTAAHQHYSSIGDLAGVALQRNNLRARLLTGRSHHDMTVPSSETAYLYRQPGSWGLSPVPGVWAEFLGWHRDIRTRQPDFKPYVDDLISTEWYKEHEVGNRTSSMWTMWFVRFCSDRNLYTLYSNFPEKEALAVNYQMAGVHYPESHGANSNLLEVLPDKFKLFPSVKRTLRLDWDGQPQR